MEQLTYSEEENKKQQLKGKQTQKSILEVSKNEDNIQINEETIPNRDEQTEQDELRKIKGKSVVNEEQSEKLNENIVEIINPNDQLEDIEELDQMALNLGIAASREQYIKDLEIVKNFLNLNNFTN